MLEVQPAVEGGFSDPVMQAQAVFRSAMDAMAHPGTIRPITPAVSPPPPLSPVMAAIACTLTDADTPIWLDEALAVEDTVRSWLAFHTGAPVTANEPEAHFAFVSRPSAMPALEGFALGSQDYPDRSTTIILQVESLGEGETFRFAGPGIRETAGLAAAPMPVHFREQWTSNRSHFPRGVDLILAGPNAVACLPRTARIVNGKG